MAFGGLFKKKQPESESESETETGPEDDGEEEVEGEAEEVGDEPSYSERAAAVLPTGASTGSKRPEALYGGEAPWGPTHYTSAEGCRLTTAEGDELIDCTMALGAVALGYAEPRVTRAALAAGGAGNVAGLSHALEVDVAEMLCDVIPCAEKVQFLKTGAEAVAAAVRIARTYTGRSAVVGCGYFGWHDWSADASGVPDGVRRDYASVPFDDVAALEAAVNKAGDSLAAIVLEPVIERLPSEQWITRARELADAKKAVLIFDEVKTGFRLATGGYQAYADFMPDLAAFGKAMANGFPLSAVCGRADLMDAARKTWISSTLAGEGMGLAAAAAVIQVYSEDEVCEKLSVIGEQMRRSIDTAVRASGLGGCWVQGIDPMWFLKFDDAAVEARFLRAAVEHGVLFKRGPYNFAALAHDDDALNEIEAAASRALVDVQASVE